MLEVERQPSHFRAEPARHGGSFADYEARVWAAERPRKGQDRCTPIGVLIVSPIEEDHARLRTALTLPSFRVRSARSFREAAPLIETVPVIIAECNLNDCCWKDLWHAIQSLDRRPWPRLIVAADAANDSLWAEVIELGAKDVLAKPFDSAEVEWVVTEAWMCWSREREMRTASERSAHAG